MSKYANSDNSRDEIKDLIMLAESGDVQSQYNLGVKYDNGNGVEKDYSKAFYWYLKSAEQGNKKGQ